MAVEFRCPECRAKLRLADAPDPGEEVECPKCSHVFPAPDSGIEFRPSRKPPAGKKPRDDDGGDDEPENKPEKPPEKKAEKKGKGPKKRRVKKKEVNKTLLYSVAGGGVFLVAVIIGLLVWYVNRVPVAFQMMAYIPEDANLASGVNVGHIQKYAEFAKTVQQASGEKGFWKAGDAVKAATGAELDYAVYGANPSGGFVWVVRSKKEFNPDDLKKLPGAKAYSADGQAYYTADDFGGFGGMKAFAPNNRIVVFASASIPDGQFRNMLKGNTANPDMTLLGRTKPLARRITRGTWWVLSDIKIPTPPEAAAGLGGQESTELDLKRVIAEHVGKGTAWGWKASAGSKDIRFEAVVKCRDSDTAKELVKKWQDSELAKGDEGTPPKWWKAVTQKAGDQKVGIELLSTLGFTTSGDLFIVKASSETRLFLNSVTTLVSNVSTVQPGAAPPKTP